MSGATRVRRVTQIVRDDLIDGMAELAGMGYGDYEHDLAVSKLIEDLNTRYLPPVLPEPTPRGKISPEQLIGLVVIALVCVGLTALIIGVVLIAGTGGVS